ERTYPSAKRAEVRAALEEVLRHVMPCLDRGRISGLIRAIGIDPETDLLDEPNPGFSAGRTLIREAFLERIAPAIAKLVSRTRRKMPAPLAIDLGHPLSEKPQVLTGIAVGS